MCLAMNRSPLSGGIAIAKALEVNSSLTYLCLTATFFGGTTDDEFATTKEALRRAAKSTLELELG